MQPSQPHDASVHPEDGAASLASAELERRVALLEAQLAQVLKDLPRLARRETCVSESGLPPSTLVVEGLYGFMYLPPRSSFSDVDGMATWEH